MASNLPQLHVARYDCVLLLAHLVVTKILHQFITSHGSACFISLLLYTPLMSLVLSDKIWWNGVKKYVKCPASDVVTYCIARGER